MPPRPRSMVPRTTAAPHVALVRPALPKTSTATPAKRPTMTVTKGPPYTASVLSPTEEASITAPFVSQLRAQQAVAAATAAAQVAAQQAQAAPESAGGSSGGVESSPASYPS